MVNLVGFILCALTGGAALGINRALLGRLGIHMGPAKASVVNHIGGALFIFFVLLTLGKRIDFTLLASAPPQAFVGGVIGALFVALISWLIPRTGVMKTTVLLISGQMFCSTALDFGLGRVKSVPVALLGLGLVLAGVLIGEYRKIVMRSN